jgi:hypothetical protein
MDLFDVVLVSCRSLLTTWLALGLIRGDLASCEIASVVWVFMDKLLYQGSCLHFILPRSMLLRLLVIFRELFKMVVDVCR